MVLDKDTDTFIYILEDRKAETLKTWLITSGKSDFSQLKSITMNMWYPFVNSIKKSLHNTESLIVFDRFHLY